MTETHTLQLRAIGAGLAMASLHGVQVRGENQGGCLLAGLLLGLLRLVGWLNADGRLQPSLDSIHPP